MTLTEIRQILDEQGIVLTKSLGQNFLHDGNQLRRIMDAAEVGPEENILEIGPGLGPLTERLIERSGHVLAIEMDARLVTLLKKKFAASIFAKEGERAKLLLIEGDALSHVRQFREWAGWKLVANLPYSVASPILVELATASSSPERMVATLQIEVARRLMARAGDPDYGVLTLLVQSAFKPDGWFKIPSGCFFPSPEVDSACVRLVKRSAPLLAQDEIKGFMRVVKQSFSQRRKMMIKLLRAEWPVDVLLAAFKEINIATMERAEKVTVEQFALLSRFLERSKSNG